MTMAPQKRREVISWRRNLIILSEAAALNEKVHLEDRTGASWVKEKGSVVNDYQQFTGMINRLFCLYLLMLFLVNPDECFHPITHKPPVRRL